MRRDTVGVTPEDFGFDFVDVVLQAGDHGCVAVHDRVQDRVQHRLRAAAQQIRIVFCSAAYRGEIRRLAVPDGEDEVVADEHVQLAEVDLLGGV